MFEELQLRLICLYMCVSEYRTSVFDVPDVRIESVGFIKPSCAFPSSHLRLPCNLVTNEINAIEKLN